MSYHILTVMTIGSYLCADRGFVVCKVKGEEEKRMPLADIRGIVIAVPQVGFSNECIARLLAQDSFILHCDGHFKPIGWSMPLFRVVKEDVLFNQLKQDELSSLLLWEAVSRQKRENQAFLLTSIGVAHKIQPDIQDEATSARYFWKPYFEALGKTLKRERRHAQTYENQALNYGYAVVSTLVHRSILIHGMLPAVGIHHESRYRADPLVYDLVEPVRSFVDYFLYRFCEAEKAFPDNELDDGFDCELAALDDDDREERFKRWIKFMMLSLRNCRIKDPSQKHSHKLMDAIDHYVNSFARAFLKQSAAEIIFPQLKHHYWQLED